MTAALALGTGLEGTLSSLAVPAGTALALRTRLEGRASPLAIPAVPIGAALALGAGLIQIGTQPVSTLRLALRTGLVEIGAQPVSTLGLTLRTRLVEVGAELHLRRLASRTVS